jgi:threonine dehydratase
MRALRANHAQAAQLSEEVHVNALESISLDDIRAASRRIAGLALRTPLVRLNMEGTPAEIYLKLENLQPIGSFKLRGAANAMLRAGREQLALGVWTPSAGNMAQGVGWTARHLGLACRVVVPEHAPQTKLDAVARLGASIVKVPFDAWWQTILSGKYPAGAAVEAPGLGAGSTATPSAARPAGPGVPYEGRLVHPVADADVIAGNGTIGLEIVDDLPDVDAVVVPYGGGGLVSGIATAIRALKPATRIFACEVETAAPLAASLGVGAPREVPYRASFVDGIGGKSILPQMWPLVSRLVDASLVVTLTEVCAAIKLLVERNRVVAEGAAATSVAAALAGRAGAGKIVCVVSGGNIDSVKLCAILAGQIP